MIRAAIVGLGWWGKTIVEAVQGKTDKISFVAANTRTRAKAEDFCRDRKIDLRDDLDAILNDPKIDAVVYTTPHSQHEEHIRRAAQARKHVCVEKPFTLMAASARAAIDAVKKAGETMQQGWQKVKETQDPSREKLAIINQGITYEEYVKTLGAKAEAK